MVTSTGLITNFLFIV